MGSSVAAWVEVCGRKRADATEPDLWCVDFAGLAGPWELPDEGFELTEMLVLRPGRLGGPLLEEEGENGS